VVLAVFVGLAGLLFRHAWADPGDRWIGLPGDPPLFMWYLRWIPYAISHGLNPVFTDFMNFPDGVNLMWNTAVPLPALLLTPLTLSIGPTATYNVLMTMGVALSGWCAYLMLRRHTSHRAAFAGALVYGFSPYILAHATAHPNLPTAFGPPLFVILLEEILVTQRRPPWKSGALLGGLALVQLLTSEELLASSVLVAGLGTLLLMILHPRAVAPRAVHAVKALAVAAALSLTLASGPLLFQFFGPQRVESGALWGPGTFVTDAWGMVVPTEQQFIHPDSATEVTAKFTDACCPAEHNAYLGAPLILVMLTATVVWWRRPAVRFTGLLAAIVIVLSMGNRLHVGGDVTDIPLPFALVADIPVLKNFLAGRLMLYVFLAGAFLVAVTLDRAREGLGKSMAVLGAGLVLLTIAPDPSFPATQVRVPEFFRSASVERIPKGSVALVAPFSRDTSTAEPMLWQARADMRYRMPSGYALGPDVNGRFSYLPIPTELSRKLEEIQQGRAIGREPVEARDRFRRELRRLRVRSVVVGPMPHRAAMVAFMRRVIGQRPVVIDGVHLWTDVDLLVAQ
jgi:hypothetical protein